MNTCVDCNTEFKPLFSDQLFCVNDCTVFSRKQYIFSRDECRESTILAKKIIFNGDWQNCSTDLMVLLAPVCSSITRMSHNRLTLTLKKEYTIQDLPVGVAHLASKISGIDSNNKSIIYKGQL